MKAAGRPPQKKGAPERDTSPIRTKKRRFSGCFDLDQLQMLIRRGPQLYHDDFLRQLEAFRSVTELFKLSPNMYLRQYDLLTSFVTKLAHLYPEDAVELPKEMFAILREFGKVMDPKIRNTFVQGLAHLRGKNVISQAELYAVFIKLSSIADKTLRKLLESFIINDVVKTARKRKDLKAASQLQTIFGTGVQDDNECISKLSINVLTKLYMKNTWCDAKTVNMIADGCFAKNSRTSACAIRFFLGKDELPGDDDDSDEEKGKKKNDRSEKQLLLAHRVGRKTHKRQKRLDRARRVLKKNKSRHKQDLLNFSAINLLYDPQSFADRLYGVLIKSNQKYEMRLNIMSLISRLIGTQNLILLNFYPFMQKYLQPRQRDVTKVLLFVAQSAHALVPPDILETVLRTIADNFITDAHAAEVIAVGLNAVREIILRCPLALGEDLASDMIGYRKHRDKIVQLAARSLVQAIRDVNPGILRRKDRGRPTEAVAEDDGTSPVFGSTTAPKDYIPGAEVLFNKNNSTADSNGSKSDVSDDDSEGWVDVSSENDSDDDDGSDDESLPDDGSSDGSSSDDGDGVEGEEGEEEEEDDGEEGGNEDENVQKSVNKILEKPVNERIEMARHISQTKIMDDADFGRVRQMQLAKSLTAARKRKPTSDPQSDENSSAEEDEGIDSLLPRLNDIERGCGNSREHDKKARMASVLKGREGREKFGGGKKRQNPNASTTNREKQRNKTFLMVRQKIVREKNKKSFRAKQTRLHKALMKIAKKGK